MINPLIGLIGVVCRKFLFRDNLYRDILSKSGNMWILTLLSRHLIDEKLNKRVKEAKIYFDSFKVANSLSNRGHAKEI